MSIFSAIGGLAKGALGGLIGGGLPGAIIGGIAGGIGGAGGGGRPPIVAGGRGGVPRLPPIDIRGSARRVLPGLGRVAAGGAAGYFAGRMQNGYAPRRRTRGFSSRDVRQAKRLMKMLKELSAVAPKPRTIRVSQRCD